MSQKSGSPAVILRPMTLSDIDAVLQIERISFPTPWPRDAFIYELARPERSICWVAEYIPTDEAPRVIGDVVIWLAGRIAHVATLAVHPDFRREGIGACLLANTLRKSIEHGMNEAILEVREKNYSAQEMYLKFGFEIIGIRDGYYRDTGEDAVVMALKPLSRDKLAEFTNCG